MKVIGIVGSRRRNSQDDYNRVCKAFFDTFEEGDEIVSGGCPQGADAFAEKIAKVYQIPIKIYYARWNEFGHSAGPQRNSKIVRAADTLIACVAADRTGGTEDTLKKFGDKGPVILV